MTLYFHNRTFREDTLGYIAPECHQEPSRHGNDGDPSDATAGGSHPGSKPSADRGVRLIAQPEPSHLDQSLTDMRIARLADPLIMIHAAALPWRRSQAGIPGDFTTVVKAAKEHFQPQHRGTLRTNSLEAEKEHGGRWCRLGRRGLSSRCHSEHGVSFGFHRGDVVLNHSQAGQMSTNLLFEMGRQWPSITGPQLIETRAVIRAPRLKVDNALTR
jgi:hypothetical protein